MILDFTRLSQITGDQKYAGNANTQTAEPVCSLYEVPLKSYK